MKEKLLKLLYGDYSSNVMSDYDNNDFYDFDIPDALNDESCRNNQMDSDSNDLDINRKKHNDIIRLANMGNAVTIGNMTLYDIDFELVEGIEDNQIGFLCFLLLLLDFSFCTNLNNKYIQLLTRKGFSRNDAEEFSEFLEDSLRNSYESTYHTILT